MNLKHLPFRSWCRPSLLILSLLGISFFPGRAQSAELLVFTGANGYIHQVTGAAAQALEEMGQKHHFGVTISEDSTLFTPAGLEKFDAVVFLNCSGDILNDAQQEALRSYLTAGRGFVGIHGATTAENEWDWYGWLVGRYFTAHPEIQTAVVRVADPDHPSAWHIPSRWIWTDEWYEFTPPMSDELQVILTVDESTYDETFTSGGVAYAGMQPEHPIAWCQEWDGGRMFYTALGHLEGAWSDQIFLQHVYGGIWWVLNR